MTARLDMKAVITITGYPSMPVRMRVICKPPKGRAYGRDFYDPGEAAAWALSEGMGYKEGYEIIAPAAVEENIPAGMQTA
jgi:hypothetical protein